MAGNSPCCRPGPLTGRVFKQALRHSDNPAQSIVRDVAGLRRFVTRMTGKMLRQQFSRAPHAMQNPPGKFTLAKMAGHFLRDFLPEFITALRMNRAIANHREFLDARSNEQQDTVLFPALVHLQMMENLFRGGHRILRLLAADKDADLPAHFGLGLGNRLDDGVVLKLAQKIARFHITNLTRRLPRQSSLRHPKTRLLHRLHLPNRRRNSLPNHRRRIPSHAFWSCGRESTAE